MRKLDQIFILSILLIFISSACTALTAPVPTLAPPTETPIAFLSPVAGTALQEDYRGLATDLGAKPATQPAAPAATPSASAGATEPSPGFPDSTKL